MKVAVTGASGFVGRHVVAELRQRGVEVIPVARLVAPIPESLQKLSWLRMDLGDASEETFGRMGHPDALIHLAWGGLPNYTSAHHFERELPNHFRFLKHLVRAGLKQIFVAGTCAEYGLQCGPLAESLDARPPHAYALAKDVLRRQLQLLQDELPFGLTWGRLFYLHGEGQGAASLASLLRGAVERGDTEFPMSGGEQLRDYLPVTTAADYIARLALSGAAHGVVNVCSGRPISVRRLVEGWIEENGWRIQPRFGVFPYPAHEPLAFWGDRTKLDQCLEPR